MFGAYSKGLRLKKMKIYIYIYIYIYNFMGQPMFFNKALPKTLHTNDTTLYISHTYMREINEREAGRGISRLGRIR
jgi:hypothetical protein